MVSQSDEFEEFSSSSCRYDHLFKVLLVGDPGTGKTSLLRSLVAEEDFREDYLPTIVIDFQVKMLKIDRPEKEFSRTKNVKLQIWDSSGQSKYLSLCENFFRGAMATICCFNVNDRLTFKNVEKWLKIVKEQVNSGTDCDPVLFVVGCQNDSGVHVREVSREEGHVLAITHKARYMEASAKTGENVQSIFESLSKSVLAAAEEDCGRPNSTRLTFSSSVVHRSPDAAAERKRRKPASVVLRDWRTRSKRISMPRIKMPQRPKSLRKSFKVREERSCKVEMEPSGGGGGGDGRRQEEEEEQTKRRSLKRWRMSMKKPQCTVS